MIFPELIEIELTKKSFEGQSIESYHSSNCPIGKELKKLYPEAWISIGTKILSIDMSGINETVYSIINNYKEFDFTNDLETIEKLDSGEIETVESNPLIRTIKLVKI